MTQSAPRSLSAAMFARWRTWFESRWCPSSCRETWSTSTPPAWARATSASPQRVETISGSAPASSSAYVPVPVRTPTLTSGRRRGGRRRLRSRRGATARRRLLRLGLRLRRRLLRLRRRGLRSGGLRRGLRRLGLLLLLGVRLVLVGLLRRARVAAEQGGPVARADRTAEDQLGNGDGHRREHEREQSGGDRDLERPPAQGESARAAPASTSAVGAPGVGQEHVALGHLAVCAVRRA